MNKITTLLAAAAVTGLITGSLARAQDTKAPADDGKGSKDTKVAACKNGCDGKTSKDGCKCHGKGKKDKNSCGGKNGCKGEGADKK
jgi:hypothetical protein